MIRFTGNRVVVSSRLNCDVESAWLLLTDTQLWPRWGPSVAAVHCDQRFIRGGSTGRVLTAFRFWLPFTITEYHDSAFWKWKVGPFEATGHRVTHLGENCCTLSFDMPWWGFPYVIVCSVALRRLRKMAAEGSRVYSPE